MSLQVWLPLNGDLRNQGLSNIAFVNNNATVNDNGKIGKCYSFNGSSSKCYSKLPSTDFSKLSIAVWAKIDSTSTGNGYIAGLSFSGSSACQIHYNPTDKKFRCYFRGNQTGIAQDITSYLDTWHHYAVTVNQKIFKLYIDGQLIQTATYNNTSLTTTDTLYAYLGCRGGNTVWYKGLLNDFRLYDHTLSPKEVEELSKGLVLHYKLDDDINNTNWLLPNSETSITRASSNTFIDYDYYSDLISNSETSYVVDFWAKGSVAGMTIDAYFRNSGGSAYAATPQQVLTTEWVHYTLSLTGSPSTMQKFRARCYSGTAGDIIYIRNMKLLSDNMPIRISTVYDSSGYSNNGTIVGSLTTAASSPRYSVATYKPNGAYIRINNRPNTIGAKDAITVNMWVNFSTWGNCISCTQSGGWNFEENSSGLRFPIYIASVGYKTAQSTITSASLKNAWHMLTGTMDSNNVKFYIDGEEAGTVATDSTNGIGYANNYIFIGGEAGADSTSPASSSFVGTVSDTRIYATALTATQVAELYNTSATIDSSGNIHTRELVE